MTNSKLLGSHGNSDKVVEDFHSTEDGEAGEEAHGAADQTKLGLQGHLPVLLYFIICHGTKVDLYNHWVVGDVMT